MYGKSPLEAYPKETTSFDGIIDGGLVRNEAQDFGRQVGEFECGAFESGQEGRVFGDSNGVPGVCDGGATFIIKLFSRCNATCFATPVEWDGDDHDLSLVVLVGTRLRRVLDSTSRRSVVSLVERAVSVESTGYPQATCACSLG